MLYLANNPLNKTGYVVIPRDAQPPAQQPGENELQYNDRLMHLSKEFIKAHPDQFAKLCLIRSYEFWRPYPKFSQFQTAKIMIACLGTLLPLYACSLWGLVLLRKNWRHLGPLLAVLIASYALHLVFGVSIRYRFPIEPLLIPTAAYSVYWLLQKNFPGWITDESDTLGKS
jgi:hypothetical protein